MKAWDVIVVGGGSAGAALTGRLAERGVGVLLLEAGPEWRTADLIPELRYPYKQHMWDAQTMPAELYWRELMAARVDDRPPYHYFMGRGMGGGSTINGCYAIRPPVEEFAEWEESGCTGWGVADVVPYFIRLETDLEFGHEPYHGSSGPIPITRLPLDGWGTMDHGLRESALSLGYPWVPDHNAPHAFGVSTTASNVRDGARVSTNDGYLEAARALPNATLMGDVLVDRVIFDGNRAVGVRARVAQQWAEYRASEVILCAGALMTPAILQRSGIGPESVLRRAGVIPKQTLPVGESLQDHAGFMLSTTLRSGQPAANGLRGNCTFRYSSGLSASGAGDSILTVVNTAGQAAAQWALPGGRRSSAQPTDGATGALLGKAFRCFSRGTVHVTSTDPFGMPVVRLNLLDDQRDSALMRQLLRRAIDVLTGPGFEGNVVAITDELGEAVDTRMTDAEVDAWAKRVVRDTVHPSSSCRMAATDDASGVVDVDLQVRGVENLRVADLSVTPWVPRANTHLVAVMIGERAADLVTGPTSQPFVEHREPDATPSV